METNQLLERLVRRQPLFDSIPPISRKMILGLESEYGSVGFNHIAPEFLPNGGLIYTDFGHPEYSTPEVSNPLSAVLYYEAGKIISLRRLNHDPKLPVSLYCHNNSWINDQDHRRTATFGAHESYATRAPRNVLFKLVPFLVARTIMSGNGWVNQDNNFEISQRASYIKGPCTAETMSNRGVINLRNEPLMSVQGYHRLHIICGDATMNQVATLLRVGTMSLVVEMLEMNALPQIHYDLSKASKDIQGISRRTSEWYLGGLHSLDRRAVTLLNLYYERAASLFAKRDLVTDTVLFIWKDTLEKLARNPMELGFRLDWVAKLILLQSFMVSEQRCTEEWLKAQDMEYHNLDPEMGLYHLLHRESQAERLFTPELITFATHEPPPDTRAFARGGLVKYLAAKGSQYVVSSGDWTVLGVLNRKGSTPFWSRPMKSPFLDYANLLEEYKKSFYEHP